jgi:hypothetical protein
MIHVKSEPWIELQVIPDRTVRNKRLDILIKAVHDMYRKRSDRMQMKGINLEWESPKRFNFRIFMTKEIITFFVAVPKSQRRFVEQRLTTIWERATIKEAEWEPYFNPQESAVCTMTLTKHSVFSLNPGEKDEQNLLQSILNLSPSMEENEQAMIDVLLEPESKRTWEFDSTELFKKAKRGETVNKIEPTLAFLLTWFGQKVSMVLDEVLGFSRDVAATMFNEITSGVSKKSQTTTTTKDEKRTGPKLDKTISGDGDNRGVSLETRVKTQGSPFNTWMRVVAQSADYDNAEYMCRTLAATFRNMDGDNEFKMQRVSRKRVKRFLQNIHARKPHTMFGYTADILTEKELERILQVPEYDLQKEFQQITQISGRQARNLPASLYRAETGIPLCHIEEKGQKKTIYVPYDDYDLFSKPHISLGQQGCGKTAGQGTNWAIGALEAGFSVFHVDSSDGLGIDEVRDAIPEWMSDDHIIELDYGNLKYPPCLNLSDVAAENAKRAGDDLELEKQITSNKLKDAIVYFIRNISSYGADGFSDRMEEYLGAAGQAVLRDPNNTIMEVAFALTSPEYIAKLLEDTEIQDNFQIYEVLERLYKSYGNGDGNTGRNKVEGIISRLNLLLNNQFAARLFFQANKVNESGEPLINFRKWADGDGKPYYVAIRIPKDDFGAEFVNRITAFVLQKWYLTILSRSNIPKADRKPCLLLWDEPHTAIQASGHILDNMAVELRKYRGKLVILGHGPRQFGKAWEAITDGGFTLSLYKTESESTYRDLAKTIQPFEPDEAYAQLPIRWVAVNKLLAKDAPEGIPAFIGQMLPPRSKVKDRSYLRELCAKQYGTYYKDVDRDISERRKAIQPQEGTEAYERTAIRKR